MLVARHYPSSILSRVIHRAGTNVQISGAMKKKRRDIFRIAGFITWLAAATFAATTLTAWHSVAFPTKPEHTVLNQRHKGRWLLTHYLSAECTCSQTVMRHLSQRGPLADAMEDVVVIQSQDVPQDNKMLSELIRSGFHVRSITAEAASSIEGVEGVPLLKIEAADGTVRYRGGYRENGAPLEKNLDTVILAGLMASAPVPSLRVFGCATSYRLRSLLDPLSFKLLSSYEFKKSISRKY